MTVPPLHRGHHPVWDDDNYHVDVCNEVDDIVVGDNRTGAQFRFPIDIGLFPWVRMLLSTMNECDVSQHPQNVVVRTMIMVAVKRRLAGNPPRLNIFEPGTVTHDDSHEVVDAILDEIITERPEAQFV